MSQLVNSPVTAVLFDIGGIFLDWDPRHLYRSMFDDEEQMEWFLENICTADWHDAHDRGQPMAASSAELAGLHPEWEREITAWSKRSEEMVGGIMDHAISVLAELKTEGIRCFALTNMEAETCPAGSHAINSSHSSTGSSSQVLKARRSRIERSSRSSCAVSTSCHLRPCSSTIDPRMWPPLAA
jgi:hypothetical protein